MHRILGVALILTLTGCPKKNVVIYRSLSEPGAMKTCDANQRFRAEVKGSDEDDANDKLEDAIRTQIRAKDGCGALITNGGTGAALDGTFNAVADFQLCTCGE